VQCLGEVLWGTTVQTAVGKDTQTELNTLCDLQPMCYWLRNTRNVAKFQENLTLSSRSSKVIDLGVNGKLICDFLLVIVTVAVSATFLDIHA